MPNPCLLIVAKLEPALRMKKPVKNQNLPSKGRPILFHTLIPFVSCKKINEIFLVVPENDILYVRDEIIGHLSSLKPIRVVPGGKERQDSVFNGLCAMKNKPDFVVIHDGVRPFITKDMIEKGLATLPAKRAARFLQSRLLTLLKNVANMFE